MIQLNIIIPLIKHIISSDSPEITINMLLETAIVKFSQDNKFKLENPKQGNIAFFKSSNNDNKECWLILKSKGKEIIDEKNELLNYISLEEILVYGCRNKLEQKEKLTIAMLKKAGATININRKNPKNNGEYFLKKSDHDNSYTIFDRIYFDAFKKLLEENSQKEILNKLNTENIKENLIVELYSK